MSHGKTLRALPAQWITGDQRLGTALALEPGTVSSLEQDSSGPQVRLWGFSAISLLCRRRQTRLAAPRRRSPARIPAN